MDSEIKKCIEDLTETVSKGSSWEGKTTREARDKIGLAAMEVNQLRGELRESKMEFSDKFTSLTDAIKDASASSTKLCKIMTALTIILGLSAMVTVFSPYFDKPEPKQSE
jgi:hypothetical protein